MTDWWRHRNLGGRLLAMLEGGLEPGEEARLRAHIGGCRRCQAELRSLEEASLAVREARDAFPALDPSEDLWSRLDARLPQRGPSRLRVPPRTLAWQGAAVSVLVAAWALLRGGPIPQTADSLRRLPSAGRVVTAPPPTAAPPASTAPSAAVTPVERGGHRAGASVPAAAPKPTPPRERVAQVPAAARTDRPPTVRPSLGDASAPASPAARPDRIPSYGSQLRVQRPVRAAPAPSAVDRVMVAAAPEGPSNGTVRLEAGPGGSPGAMVAARNQLSPKLRGDGLQRAPGVAGPVTAAPAPARPAAGPEAAGAVPGMPGEPRGGFALSIGGPSAGSARASAPEAAEPERAADGPRGGRPEGAAKARTDANGVQVALEQKRSPQRDRGRALGAPEGYGGFGGPAGVSGKAAASSPAQQESLASPGPGEDETNRFTRDAKAAKPKAPEEPLPGLVARGAGAGSPAEERRLSLTSEAQRYERLARGRRSPALWVEAGRAWLSLGSWKPAMVSFQRALSLKPGYGPARAGLEAAERLARGEKPPAR